MPWQRFTLQTLEALTQNYLSPCTLKFSICLFMGGEKCLGIVITFLTVCSNMTSLKSHVIKLEHFLPTLPVI